MNNFSISQLQQYSGIKAHTIRIWEQRYNALTPNRSEGNTRYYDDLQLRRLLNIVSLMDREYKVSQLCSMPDEKLFDLIKSRLISTSSNSSSIEYFVSQLIAAGMCFDVVAFEKIFSKCIEKFGIKDSYLKVIYPLLDRIGLMWSCDTMPPAHEHFISNIIRQKLFSAIDELPITKALQDTWLLFLPENEFHEIGLLFSYFLIRNAGRSAVYLGSNVPLNTLVETVKEISPSNLLFFLVHNDTPDGFEKYCNALTKNFEKIKIYLAGNEEMIGKLKTDRSIKQLRSAADLEKEVS